MRESYVYGARDGEFALMFLLWFKILNTFFFA